jgi:hypothetical protein
MNTSQYRLSRPTWALLMLLATLASSSALAAGKSATLDPKVRYQRESAACASIRVFDDRANCLSEASTRFASTQPARADEHPDILMRNALKRCEPLPEAERKDCMARMQGQGTTSGSVASGAIYRELVTREVGVAPAVQPAPASAPAAAQ